MSSDSELFAQFLQWKASQAQVSSSEEEPEQELEPTGPLPSDEAGASSAAGETASGAAGEAAASSAVEGTAAEYFSRRAKGAKSNQSSKKFMVSYV